MAASPGFRYRILRPLGGGASRVSLALDPMLDRKVVLKVFSDDDPARRDRLATGVRAATRLHHLNIVTIFDYGEHDGQVFVAMEYVDGVTLAEKLKEGPPSPELARKWMLELARALAHAHQAGIIHRRIRPDNLMIDASGAMKVLNFGSAPPAPDGITSEPLTEAGLSYVAPEELRHQALEPASDSFAFGAVCYEVFSGRKAFDGTVDELLSQIRDARVERPLAELQPSTERPIVQLIERCLQREPADRPTMTSAAYVLQRSLTIIKDPAAESNEMSVMPGMVGGAQGPVAVIPAPAAPRRLDQNVQFTVYRPSVLVPDRWHTMPVFAHLADRRPDAPPDEPDPLAEVSRRAKQTLGADADTFPQLRQDSRAAIPQEGVLRIVPTIPGVRFNPPEHRVLWLESIHQADFRMRASRDMDGQVARGSIVIYLGLLPIAEIALAIPVKDRAPVNLPSAPQTARPYHRIFASYSHKDAGVVREFEAYAKGFGDRYMRDVIDLRAGEQWDGRLCEFIDTADVFQLFWSTNSMQSPFVRREWEHALTVNKSDFIRPLYWEIPFPEREGLPPAALKARHFAFVGANLDALLSNTVARPRGQEVRREEEAPRSRLDDTAQIHLDLGHDRLAAKDTLRIGSARTEPTALPAPKSTGSWTAERANPWPVRLLIIGAIIVALLATRWC